jgi:hypothetical protein
VKKAAYARGGTVAVNGLSDRVSVLRHRLLPQPGVSQRPLAVVVQADLTYSTRAQPAQQRCGVLLNLDAAALGTTALACKDHNHLIAVEELLRLAPIGLPNIADVGAPAHDAFVTLIDGRVEHALGEVKAHGRIEQVGELAPPRDQRAAHYRHVLVRDTPSPGPFQDVQRMHFNVDASVPSPSTKRYGGDE